MDVMFYAMSGAQHPTERDKNTLLKVYSYEFNHPQHDQALSVLKEQIERQPKNPKLYYLLGSIYLDKGDYENAKDSFIYCLELDLFYGQAGEKLVQAYLKLNRNDDAIQQYERLLKQNPSPETYNSAGGLYYKQGNIEQAIRYFEEALEIDRRYLPAKNNLFNIYKGRGAKYLEAGDYDGAISDFTRAMELFPNDSGVYDLMGASYAGKGDYEKGIEYYEKAVILNPGNTNAKNNLAGAYNNWGVVLVRQQKFQEAIGAYNKALEIMPENDQFKRNLESAYWNLSNYYIETKYGDKAIETYRQLLKLNPTNKDARSAIAGMYYNLGRYPEAIEFFKTALQIDEENAENKQNLFLTHWKYGQVLLEQHRYQDAVTQFEEALKIQPDNTDTLLNLGAAYQRAGKPEEALATYEKALAIKPDDDKIKRFILNLHANQANKYMQARKYKSAIKTLEKIPEEDRSADISGSIGYLYIITKQPILALPHLDRALEKNPKDDDSYQNLRSIESNFDIKLHKNKSQKVKDNLALTRCSLAKALMHRKKISPAKAKLRQAFDLTPQSLVAKKALIITGIKLAKTFQAKKWNKNAREVAKWVLELEPENETVKNILGD
ncbi:MAG: tetratricopeptide repeat protein [Deltaproteobacteria bacterium]|nr:tetratricopeptide repeat protein [Deltaproteobacteria bacterium]